MKKKTTRRQVLLSFLGTTDPIRGERDGAMLHILRHYRPEVVCLLFTPEVRKLAEADERYEKVFFHLKSHWDGYAPVVLGQDFSVSDVSDMDELDQPLHDVMNRLSREYADAEILVNITSGTPQMQMLLSQMVLELRYHARGIQVKTPEKKAGTTVRTNDSENYDIDLEIECNEDEQEGAPNRCVEPEMFSVRRKNQWQQVEALLNQLLPRRYGYDLTHVQSRYGGRMKIEPGLMQEKTPEQIISLIERCILLLFPACDPEVFHIYERIIRYIQKQY